MIADSWIQIEQFRLLVLHTAWKIDQYNDYQRVRADISAVKAAMPKVLHDVAARALQIHGSLGVDPRDAVRRDGARVVRAWAWPTAPTEVHKVTAGPPAAEGLHAHARPVPDRAPAPKLKAEAEARIRRRAGTPAGWA